MAIIWCGGEPEDFSPIQNVHTSGRRLNFARVSLIGSTTGKTLPFQTLTDCWVTCRFCATSTFYGNAFLQLADHDTNNRITLHKNFDAISLRKNADEIANSGNIGLCDGTIHKLDMYLSNYGANATVIVYMNGMKIIEYEGDVSFAGVTGFNCLRAAPANSSSHSAGAVSEFIVATEDTRMMSLKTLAPVDHGDINEWEGDYTNINETGLDINDYIYTTELDKLFNAKLSGMPQTGHDYNIQAVKIFLRAGASNLGGIQFGVKTLNVNHLSETKNPEEGRFEEFYHLNPETNAPWTFEEIENLQVAIKSVAL